MWKQLNKNNIGFPQIIVSSRAEMRRVNREIVWEWRTWKQSKPPSPTKRKKVTCLRYRWGALVPQLKLCGVYFSEDIAKLKKKIKKKIYWMAPCPLRVQSLPNHHTKLWSSGFLSEGEEHWHPHKQVTTLIQLVPTLNNGKMIFVLRRGANL